MEKEVSQRGHLFKSSGLSFVYCPICGKSGRLNGTEEKRTRSDGKEEFLTSCSECGCEFWAYENYFTDMTREKRAERLEVLNKMSKEELIELILAKEHLVLKENNS